jgi:hypothetical protein
VAVVGAGSSGPKKAEGVLKNYTDESSVCSKGGCHGDHLLAFVPVYVVA